MKAINSSLPLPSVYDTLFQSEQLAQLFDDIAACTCVSEILLKNSEQTYGHTQPVTLEDAFQKVTQQEVRGVQIRYHYAGQDWCDTILKSQDGYRVVRIAQGDVTV